MIGAGGLGKRQPFTLIQTKTPVIHDLKGAEQLKLLKEAFSELHRHLYILLIPIGLDLLSLWIGWQIAGFHGTSKWSVRVGLEMGLPSVSHLLNRPLAVNTMEFLNAPEAQLGHIWIIVLFVLIITAFMQGAYIGSLFQMAKGKQLKLGTMMQQGREYLLRFVFLAAMFLLAKIVITSLSVMFFGVLGMFFSFAVFHLMRIVLIYWEFTMVVSNVNIDTAFRASFRWFASSIPQTCIVIITSYAVSGGMSGLIHWLWSPATLISAILIFSYIMSGFQYALMKLLLRCQGEDIPMAT